MSGEKLQSEAQTGAFDETAEIQMSGHPDWRLAKTISALTFQTPDPELEEAPAVDAVAGSEWSEAVATGL